MDGPDRWDPSSPQNRERTRESQRQVRAILMGWDPIGVAGAPEAADEYDCMISPLMHQLFDGASERSLTAWIKNERTKHFGLDPDETSDRALARQLCDWWAARRLSE